MYDLSVNQTQKIIVAVIITTIVVGGGVYFWQQNEVSKTKQTQSTPSLPDTVLPINESEPVSGLTVGAFTNEGWEARRNEEGNLYTYYRHNDRATDISFAVPKGWIVSQDEAGNLLLYRSAPYLTVGFQVFNNKETWQQIVNIFKKKGVNSDDALIKDENITVEEFPTIWLVYERRIGSPFQYGEYFVDQGTKWYRISTADPRSPEIHQIIRSIRF